ncbi:hypothetical protein Tco_1156002 [Tanacetum coccineum]
MYGQKASHVRKSTFKSSTDKLAWQILDWGDMMRYVDLSKGKSGVKSPPEFQRSFYVEGHIRSGVISSVLAQRHLRNSLKKGDEGPSSRGTKLSSTFITAEVTFTMPKKPMRRTYNGIYSLFYKDINLSLKEKDPAFLIRQNREKESKAKKLMIENMQAITRAKSNSIHGSIKAM